MLTSTFPYCHLYYQCFAPSVDHLPCAKLLSWLLLFCAHRQSPSISDVPKQATAGLQRYTIRDLNTGQLYVLDGDEGPLSPDDPASPASGTVTDIIQGRQLSLDEFEQVLGLNAVLEVRLACCLPHALVP